MCSEASEVRDRGTRARGAPEGLDGTGLRIGVVRARWNSHIVDRLAQGVGRGLAGARRRSRPT